MNYDTFLLGGHDLEMKEIHELLTEQRCRFFDRNLQWGAGLSAYQDILNDRDQFIGIELTPDIPLPLHYNTIDHHNEYPSRPSSIEQVARVLGIELNHRQLLVAANDVGYIPGMIVLGATASEIAEIRKQDRIAQGVTEADEQYALQSIQKNLTKIGDITMVKSLTIKFSAINDQLYPCPRLLIYTDQGLTYYGIGAGRLSNHFPELLRQGIIYFGGGSDGFFGVKPGHLSVKELEIIRDSIVRLINQI